MKTSKPIRISPEVLEKCSGPAQFAKFDRLVGGLLAVPHAKIAARVEDARFHSALNDNRRGPKRKRKYASPAPGASPQV